jgi:protein-tyrosine phosphatase
MRVLVVCSGNICRSPTAEAVLRHRARQARLELEVDSAGTHGYHVGEPPDERAQAHARRRGYDLSGLRARRIGTDDFRSFDLLLAMDRGHLAILQRMAPAESRSKMRLLMEFAPQWGTDEVPDPYYGGPQGFEQVLDMIEAAAEGLLQSIKPAM